MSWTGHESSEPWRMGFPIVWLACRQRAGPPAPCPCPARLPSVIFA
ncbi:hypothetical protein DVDV_2494 [Desulfovibrio sp. DV]|nr:hypothetical protein DVDV_2494 [Desulfovibrio sp. DV]